MVKKLEMKKIVMNIMVMAGVFLFFLSARGISALAAGPSYNFDFSFSYVGEWLTTSVEEKNTADYLSMKCTWSEIEGSCYDAWATDSNGDYSGGSARFYEGTWALLGNYIYENGSRNAMITARLVDESWATGEGGNFSGYWYADSGIQ